MSFRPIRGGFVATTIGLLLPVAIITAVIPPVVAQDAQAIEGLTINNIQVVGTKNTNPDIVRLASGLKVGTPFRTADFQATTNLIMSKGFYSRVFPRTEVTADKKLNVIFEVVENPVIANIVLTGNKSIKSEKLLALVTAKPGEVLNTNDLEKDVARIQDYYAKEGYNAIVPDQIDLDPKTRVLTIPIIETTIEDIKIEGNTKTKSYVILREFRSKPGSVYNANKLQRDLSRVFNLGIVEVDNARPEPGSDLGKVKITVPVKEQRTGQVGVVFGYSTRQRLTGTLELGETNFRGRGQTANVSWTVGGIAARNSFEVGFTEPWIDKNNTSLGIDLYDRVLYRFNNIFSSNATSGQDNTPYYEERRGGSLTTSRPFTETSRGFITIRTEKIRANNLQVNYNNLSDDQINNIRGSLVQNGNVTSVTFREQTNTRDYDLDPSKGIFFSPSFEVGAGNYDYQKPRIAPGYISSTATPSLARLIVDSRTQTGQFTKLNFDVRRYISLSGPRLAKLTEPKRVLAFRFLSGTAQGNIGFAEQYFVGGAETLRGYADDRFWGNRLFLASSELRQPLTKDGSLGGVLFVDVGDAWGGTDVNRDNVQGFEQHVNFKPHAGFGFGVRVKTPIGPVRLDYGIGETKRVHFAIGQSF